MELLSLRLEQFCPDSGPSRGISGIRMTSAERESTHEAARILQSDLRDSPSISRLSRLVGMNTTKLKRYFKAETGYSKGWQPIPLQRKSTVTANAQPRFWSGPFTTSVR